VLWVVALILWLLPRASTAQCLATRTIAEGASVTATTTGAATAPYSTLYVLTDNSGVVADQNATGNFTIATAGSYRIYVLNYDTGNVPTGVPPTAGSNISAITGGCFNSGDFASEYLCVVVNSANCIATRTICQGDALTVSTAGNNSTAGYATLFVLVDNATGLVVASNSTGDFTSSVSGGNSYTILTLNYDTANPPAPLPVNAGDDPSTIGSTTMGCYNTDFLTEQLCVTVDNCASGCVATRTISQGDPLSVSTTGNNTTVGYSTVFVLADAVTGIVVSSNTTGVFTNDVTCGESYAILTLNYDTANPPSPLPINAGDDVTTIGSTTAGCYNSDFLTAFLCVNVNPCTNCLATRTICQGDAVQVSTTGDNTTPGYVTVYILANSSNDQVVASNSTGTFTNDVTSGNSYYIVTLNYNASNPPVPLAINPGDNVTGMGDSSPGCYNSDLLTERLCLTVNTCCTANAGDIDQVEMCQGAAAPSDLTPLTPSYGGGFGPAPNPAADYSYAYFLTADAAPNAILQGPVATANLFTYNTLAAGTYRVYGFSYRTVQGPLTNTTAGSPILGVGLTGGTCYEATFTNLVVNPIPAPPTLSDAVYCTGQAAAALDATTSGAVSYSWSDASTAPTLTPSTATAAVTIYAVTVTGTGGCTATQDAQITVNQTPTATITPSGPTTLCAPATVDLTASGGGTYAWSTGAATATITASASGTYTVTVTNNGCTATASQVVTVNSATASITPSGPTTFCTGGSVVLVANGGGTYAWSTGEATQSITASTTGTYTVTVTSTGGCTATASQAVTVNSTTASITPSGPTTLCAPATVDLTASGGGTYAWSTGAATATITASASGTYTVTVTNNGCTATASQSVTVNSATASITPSGPTTFCTGGSVVLVANGGGTYAWSTGAVTQSITASTTGTYTVTVTNNGCTATASQAVTVNSATASITPSGPTTLCAPATVDLTASGGGTYAWSTGAATATITASASGTYTVTVTNNGCTATASQVVTVNSATASITPSGPTTFCTGGSVVLVANGGGSYAWSTGAVTQSITASTTGTYTVTVTGAGGCTATASQAVTVNSATASITPSGPTTLCAPATVDLTASGGGTYAWSTGAATATITVSASGTYTVTVTNNGCTATASQSVTVNSATASITPSGPTTFCTGGSVVLVANGGGTYAWSTGAATQSITASATGTYTVTVTGAGGCTATASQVVTANNAPTANAGADQSICSGQSATLTATGGGTYLWSTGEATASINVSPASATIYTVTVTGVGGCTASDAVSVAVSTTPTATASNNGPVCDTRDIILSASGGSTYAWSGPNGFSSTSQTSVILSGSPQFPGVGTWTYTVTVTNGTCSATASTTITVNASPSITASSNSPVCAGSTLQLTSNYSNPTGGDIYAWAGPNGFSSSQANPTISNVSILNGGVYTLTVANQFSCTSSTTTTVTIANTPNANITSNVVCNGGIATVNLLVASAGGGSTYAWSGTGATGTGNSQTIVGLAPGLQIYTVTITTVSGCTASSTTTINVPSCFVCDAAAGTVSVSNGCVGSPLAASVSGNNTTAGYTTQFIVTNTAGTIVYIGAAPINGLAAGNYLLHSYNYSVQPTPAPAVGGSIADYVTNTNNTGCYDVSNGMAFTVAAAAPALVGTSSLSQGNGGGTSPFYYNIEVLTVEGGTIPYDFEWDNTGYVRYDIAYGDADGDGIGDATITVYYSDNAYWNVTVTDAGACGNSTPVIFTNEPGAGTDLLLDITNYVITAQSGTTNNGAVNITVSGGGAGCTPYSYAWSGPNGFTATTEDISSLEYGWYSVTVTCADGSENTVGWYWVPRNRRGRSKTDGDMIGLAAMPNPFNSQTNIEFYVSQDAHTTVSVFAADGKRVAVLFSDRAVADEVYSVSLDGGSLPAGVYTVVMNTDTGEVQTYKVILTK